MGGRTGGGDYGGTGGVRRMEEIKRRTWEHGIPGLIALFAFRGVGDVVLHIIGDIARWF